MANKHMKRCSIIREMQIKTIMRHYLTPVRIACLLAKSLQSCLTLCDPIDGSPRGSPIPEILQARTLEWVAIAFSNAGKWKVKVKSLSLVWLLATPWTGAHQAPPSMGFSRQEHWSGVPLPSPPVRMATIKKSTNNKWWKGYGKTERFLHCWWECKLIQPLWKTVWGFLKN